MHPSRRLVFVALALPGLLLAQPVPPNRSIPSERPNVKPTPAQVMAAAHTLRMNTAARVANGELTPEQAVERLRQSDTASGLGIVADADFAFAAIDVGRRLLASGQAAEAEKFFTAAEKSLDQAIRKTPNSAARDQAQFLQARALIRAHYLNKLAEGRADLEAALQLLPDDKHLRQLRNLLSADPAATLQNHKEQPVRG